MLCIIYLIVFTVYRVDKIASLIKYSQGNHLLWDKYLRIAVFVYDWFIYYSIILIFYDYLFTTVFVAATFLSAYKTTSLITNFRIADIKVSIIA